MRFVLKDGFEHLGEFEIEFTNLRDGHHEFRYKLNNTFFEAFENNEVLDAAVRVLVKLEKQPQMLQMGLTVTGIVNINCDRCLEALNMPVDNECLIIYKFTEEASKQETQRDYELIFIAPQDYSINVAKPIYESVLLNVPMIRNCDLLESKPCNQEMLQKLEELKQNGEEESDPRWDKLKDYLK